MPVDLKFKKIKKNCLNCGKLLKLNNNRDIGRKLFCSRNCSSSYYFGFKKINLGRKHSETSKIKMSKSMIGKYLGSNNPNYKDGRSIFRKMLLGSTEKVCSKCDSNGYLIAHHIIPCKRENSRSRRIIQGDHSRDNGKFLCASCHKKYHWGLNNVTSKIR